MKIGIFGKITSENKNNNLIFNTFDFFSQKKVDIFIYEPFYKELNKNLFFYPPIKGFFKDDNVKDLDLVISIGGDGTFLECVAVIKNSTIPMVGINTGRLGFLTSISEETLFESLTDLLNNNFSIEERTLLDINIKNCQKKFFNYALNELVVQKKDTSSMITIDAYVNNYFLNTYWADGLIIATPTGSTAYSLSTGGPIIVPGSENFVITPIAPHTLTVRPIVVPDNTVIKLRVRGRGNQFLAAIDARNIFLNHDTELIIKKAPFKLKIIKFHHSNYFATLRSKLMWGKDSRN